MYRIKETVEAVNKIGQLMKDGSSYVNEHPEVCMIPILSQIAISIAVIADCIDGVEDEGTAPVVRCKDCKWWDKVDNIDGVNYGTCERKCTAIRKDAFPNENWYCADGEKVTE